MSNNRGKRAITHTNSRNVSRIPRATKERNSRSNNSSTISNAANPASRASRRSGRSGRKRRLQSETKAQGSSSANAVSKSQSSSSNADANDDDGHIFVAVRPRPLTTQELAKGSWTCVEVRGKKVVLQDPKDATSKDPLHRTRATNFSLDAVFTAEADQKKVFDATSKRIIGSILNGKNGTIFAYGATGSGKTYTMTGTAKNPGLIPKIVSSLLKRLEHDQLPFRIKVSYIEIYNETMRDLLTDPDGRQRPVALREHPSKGVMIMGCQAREVQTEHEVDAVIKEGDCNRATDSHSLNKTSSRSHAIFQMKILVGNKRVPIKLSLIDLAGSERAKKTKTDKKMLNEGANINKSLLTLAKCITALGMKSKKGLFIPYRDSKLTRVLKDSLCGDCSTSMIACISSSSCQFDETRETLTYAHRARNVKIKPLEQTRVKIHREEYNKMVGEMKEELGRLRSTIGYSDMNKQLIEIERSGSDTKDSPASGIKGNPVNCNKEAAQKLADELVQNFQDRIQARQSMLELREQSASNMTQVSDLQHQLGEMARRLPTDSKAKIKTVYKMRKQKIRDITKMLRKLGEGENTNTKMYNEMKEELQKLESQGHMLMEKAARSKWSKEGKHVLRSTIERCMMELKNAEHELHARFLMSKLTSQESAIKSQQQLLKKHNISFVPLDERMKIYNDLHKEFRFGSKAPKLEFGAHNAEMKKKVKMQKRSGEGRQLLQNVSQTKKSSSKANTTKSTHFDKAKLSAATAAAASRRNRRRVLKTAKSTPSMRINSKIRFDLKSNNAQRKNRNHLKNYRRSQQKSISRRMSRWARRAPSVSGVRKTAPAVGRRRGYYKARSTVARKDSRNNRTGVSVIKNSSFAAAAARAPPGKIDSIGKVKSHLGFSNRPSPSLLNSNLKEAQSSPSFSTGYAGLALKQKQQRKSRRARSRILQRLNNRRKSETPSQSPHVSSLQRNTVKPKSYAAYAANKGYPDAR